MNKKLSLVEVITSYVFGFIIVALILTFMSEVDGWDIVIFQIVSFIGFVLLFKSIRIVLHDFIEALNPPEETSSDFVKGIVEESAIYDDNKSKNPTHWIKEHWSSGADG